MPRTVLLPRIDASRCTGCGWCVAACPLHLLTLEVAAGRKTSTLHDAPTCPGCRKCAAACPFDVISMGSAAVPSATGCAPPPRDAAGSGAVTGPG